MPQDILQLALIEIILMGNVVRRQNKKVLFENKDV